MNIQESLYYLIIDLLSNVGSASFAVITGSIICKFDFYYSTDFKTKVREFTHSIFKLAQVNEFNYFDQSKF